MWSLCVLDLTITDAMGDAFFQGFCEYTRTTYQLKKLYFSVERPSEQHAVDFLNAMAENVSITSLSCTFNSNSKIEGMCDIDAAIARVVRENRVLLKFFPRYYDLHATRDGDPQDALVHALSVNTTLQYISLRANNRVSGKRMIEAVVGNTCAALSSMNLQCDEYIAEERTLLYPCMEMRRHNAYMKALTLAQCVLKNQKLVIAAGAIYFESSISNSTNKRQRVCYN
jgi:hypothetical protein